MSDEPTIEEELQRKAGEALAWLDNEHKRGSIGDKELIAALSAFDMTTMGLIPMEFNDWAQERRSEVEASAQRDNIVLTKDIVQIYVGLNRAVGGITIIMYGKGVLKSRKVLLFENETDSIKAASLELPKLIKKFQDAGYEVLE